MPPPKGPTHRVGAAWVALVTLGAVAGMLGSLAPLAWWLELFSHFRPQYALLLAVCAVVLFARSRHAAGLAALALAAANALPLAHYLLPQQQLPAVGPELRAVLVNVWSRNHDYRRLLDYIRGLQPDFAVFLEVTPAWRKALRGLEPSLPYQASAGDVLVASRRPLTGLRAMPLDAGARMALVFSTEAGGQPVTVIGAHADWPLGPAIAASRNRQLADLAAIARAAPGPVLLLGDLNVTAFSPAFADMLARSGLRDCATGRGFKPSWPVWFPPLFMQIDHCLASPGLAVARLATGLFVGSDHYPLEVGLRLAAPPPDGRDAVTAHRPARTFRR